MSTLIPFAEYCSMVEAHIESRYGIRVITRDVPDPLTGDLDGADIHIDHALNPEQRLFLLAHLFGHTVQWNVSPESFDIGRPQEPPLPPSQLPALMEYEREGAGYALAMLHEIGIQDADQWFSDYTSCDMAYLRHYYLTGEKKEFLSFWRDGSPVLGARPVPHFVPMKRTMRSDGIVI